MELIFINHNCDVVELQVKNLKLASLVKGSPFSLSSESNNILGCTFFTNYIFVFPKYSSYVIDKVTYFNIKYNLNLKTYIFPYNSLISLQLFGGFKFSYFLPGKTMYNHTIRKVDAVKVERYISPEYVRINKVIKCPKHLKLEMKKFKENHEFYRKKILEISPEWLFGEELIIA